MPEWAYNLEMARIEWMYAHPTLYWLAVAACIALGAIGGLVRRDRRRR